ncbi:MAG: hypothetical protein QMD71_00155 [bacterium]|nr:hypothetical protein [bacterium]
MQPEENDDNWIKDWKKELLDKLQNFYKNGKIKGRCNPHVPEIEKQIGEILEKAGKKKEGFPELEKEGKKSIPIFLHEQEKI